ncbi:hypothetical protein DS745_23695 [Anaerobacillus alkaliphilus]|uniref:DUF218 domain-containing protein n=1 Tax=Anaerobacillus alkaliphilus TaxID=1548597 RepID=A0A4Q0VNN4_9BACI|nr:hypothetical protein [Anaerobacillus alkaliphilus]RXI96704.1 hypothetical protein DS745_23695 [Anaerobacillus alkaliphilus]
MNEQFTRLLAEHTFKGREYSFTHADVVLYHPGHYMELNEQIVALYQQEGFEKIMIPKVFNKFLGEEEYAYHKELLSEMGIPEEIILPIEGEAASANEIIEHAMSHLAETSAKKVLLAGKTFFMKRFLLIATAFAKEDMVLDVLPLVDKRGLNKENWHETEQGKKRVFHEFQMIAQFLSKYQSKG